VLLCHGAEPRRKLKEAGFGNVIESPGEYTVDHNRIKADWNRWWAPNNPHKWPHSLIGSVSDKYLRSRWIVVSLLQASIARQIQCCPSARYDDRHSFPAMIAKAYSLFGSDTLRPAATHVTFLRCDGSGKAPVPQPKKTYGSTGGAAIYFGPSIGGRPENCEWIIGEGIETVLSYMDIKRRSGRHGRYGPGGVVALSAGGLKWLDLPPFVRRVTVAADNDGNDGPGLIAAQFAARRWLKQGRSVRLAIPPVAGEDWNDILIGVNKGTIMIGAGDAP
jgi:hypothetical protein